jgi:hypothetical protein
VKEEGQEKAWSVKGRRRGKRPWKEQFQGNIRILFQEADFGLSLQLSSSLLSGQNSCHYLGKGYNACSCSDSAVSLLPCWWCDPCIWTISNTLYSNNVRGLRFLLQAEIKIVIFWASTVCTARSGYMLFGGTGCVHMHGRSEMWFINTIFICTSCVCHFQYSEEKFWRGYSVSEVPRSLSLCPLHCQIWL